jgi:hypothetical protein
MEMRHINGDSVPQHELEERVLADELIWMGRLLEHHAGRDENADRILNVADDALHFGNTRRPYWQAVDAFMARHRDVLMEVLRMDASRVLIADFRTRFEDVFVALQKVRSDETIEEFDTEFRQYLAEIAAMMHEMKHLASEKGQQQMTLEEARLSARSSIVARAWDQGHNLSLVKQATVLPVVQDDGSLSGKSEPAILQIGKFKRRAAVNTQNGEGWPFTIALLRAS